LNLRLLRLGEGKKKKEERKKKPQGKNTMACPIPYGGHNQYNSVYSLQYDCWLGDMNDIRSIKYPVNCFEKFPAGTHV